MQLPSGFVKMMHEAEQEMVPVELREKGWIYRDLPGTCSPEAWVLLLKLMGEPETDFKLLISTTGTNKHGEKYVRGQFFLSPQAIENMKDKERLERLRKELSLN